ncbi:unnamed protein product [Lepeophtheirus salmonis]|uniref:(salmon louse) hypothetical protein n=1 Tax=Lepeophtheirus salmonis TaxID=72036 RepID=A0A7R8CEM5_LEPSM|nr:unnamed protein product [Lepeophtheirus salmonis]CAF2792449.1 unnamed protein product [Lepeophtheirus salmonis]
MSETTDKTMEDETELLELVTDTLERNGVLGKLKAELRSNVYLAMENGDQSLKRSRQSNSSLQEFVSTSDGRLALHLVREFLHFFNLKFSQSVFDVEAIDASPKERNELIENMGFSTETAHISKNPLLFEILRLSKVSILRSETPTYHTTADDHSTSGSINDIRDESEIEEGALTPSPTKSEVPTPIKTVQQQDLIRKELFSLPQKMSSLGDLPPSSQKQISKQKMETVFFNNKDSTSEKDVTSSVEEEIEEDLDELLDSNMSEDFTKDETLSDSPKVDYIESL